MGIIIFYYLRSLLENLLISFSIFSFSKTKVDIRKLKKAFLFLGGTTFIVRSLPIENSIQCILNIITLFVASHSIYKFDIIASIKYSLISITLAMVSEAVGVGIMFVVARDMFEKALSSSIKIAAFYTWPVVIIYLIIVLGYYFIAKKNGQLKVNYR